MKPFKRSSGVLLPVFSLPSNYGIGTIGKAAYDFIDFLHSAKQAYWQILPVGSTGFGDSPYQSFSTYAGNPYFIDLDLLIKDGLISKDDVDRFDWGNDPEKIDYGKIYSAKFAILEMAYKNGIEKDREKYEKFKEENRSWLGDYSLFMAVKKHFDFKPRTQWPEADISRHEKNACDKYREVLKTDVEMYGYIQYLFFDQWENLRRYADEKGIKLIGDLPIYVAADSADVWRNPEMFLLDKDNKPIKVAGVPPDDFTELGQLWGNPLYDWQKMKRDGYGWWIRRIDGARKLYDVIRIDHFRGFESYWAVPAGDKNAIGGKWEKGPGEDIVNILKNWFCDTFFIAEDLGYLTGEVKDLLAFSGFPGMKILEFAFNPREPSDYLPYKYEKNRVCYVGTHDNRTALGWLETGDKDEIAFAQKYMGVTAEGFVKGLLHTGMASVADLFISQMGDWLNVGREGRINTPGTDTGNWIWRMKPGLCTEKLAGKMAEMTVLYGRRENSAKTDKNSVIGEIGL